MFTDAESRNYILEDWEGHAGGEHKLCPYVVILEIHIDRNCLFVHMGRWNEGNRDA